jgi:two-component system, NtrC family, response regulator
MPRFSNYRWPGNIRELENIIERLVVLTAGDEIRPSDLPPFLQREYPSVDTMNIDLPAQGISLK